MTPRLSRRHVVLVLLALDLVTWLLCRCEHAVPCLRYEGNKGILARTKSKTGQTDESTRERARAQWTKAVVVIARHNGQSPWVLSSLMWPGAASTAAAELIAWIAWGLA
jgi:hypothetical protein